MARPVSLGWLLTLLVAAPVAAQFGRPPAPPPRPPTPPPVISRPPVVPQQPPIGANRPRPTTGPGLMPHPYPALLEYTASLDRLAVIGGVYAASPVSQSIPANAVFVSSRPAVDRPALQAVVGGSATPADDTPLVWRVPDQRDAEPQPADDADWVPVALGGFTVMAGLMTACAVAVYRRGGRVRVFDVPPGEAPAWVRRAWVGVELPTVRRLPRAVPSFQVLSGSHVEPGLGYEVPGPAAVAAVLAVNPDAAEWWRANVPGVLDPGYLFIFPADVCERIG